MNDDVTQGFFSKFVHAFSQCVDWKNYYRGSSMAFVGVRRNIGGIIHWLVLHKHLFRKLLPIIQI